MKVSSVHDRLTIRMSRFSIKMRLTLWFTLVSFGVLLVVQGVIILIAGSDVVDDADTLLVMAVQKNVQIAAHIDPEEDELQALRNGVYTAVYTEAGGFLDGADPVKVDLPFQNGLTRTFEAEDGNYLVYDLFLAGQNLWVRGVIEEGSHENLIETILHICMFTLPIVVILGALGGYLVANQALMPLRKITEAANAISDGNDLSLRIGLGKPGSRDELRKLSDTFDNMFERLENSFIAQQRFTSDASHELRTPTTVILAECEYTAKHAKTKEDYRSAMEVVNRQAKKMSRLVESLLSMTRMDLGTAKVNFERVDISEMLSVICTETDLVGRRGITMETDIEEGLWADVDVTLISRLVQNLIDNAYRYGVENGHVQVGLKREGESLRLWVRDDGVGISEENLDKIWGRFYQEDSSRCGGEGLGLGLSMVRQISDLHSGKMEVMSEERAGSTFTFIFPVEHK